MPPAEICRAQNSLKQAIEHLHADPSRKKNPGRRSLELHESLLVGLVNDPKSGVSAAEAAAFADQSVAALRDATSARLG
jgi:hypothetical protein